ncbi:hypothetical protein ACFWYW_59350 [Nonomuraea sp. NPDC059023]|uniref:hypothetical protein n=1 Tax=unclassified Nonomuraea TaxID=2593643 RepID=UPI003699E912
MTSTIEPLVVYDCSSRQWHGDPEVLAWMRAEGLDPDQVYRLEIYLVDCPSARVYEYATVQGARILVPAREEYLRRKPYDVILSSLPPDTPAQPEEKRG